MTTNYCTVSERIRGESTGDVRTLSLSSLRKSTRALWPLLVAGLAVMNCSCGNAEPLEDEVSRDQSEPANQLTYDGAIQHIEDSVEAGQITPEAAKYIVVGLLKEDDFRYNARAVAVLRPLLDRGFDLTPIILAMYEYRAENLDDLEADYFRVARQSLIVLRLKLPEHYAVIFVDASSIDRAYGVLLQQGVSAIVIEDGADRGLAFPEDQEANAWQAFESDPDSREYLLIYIEPPRAHRTTWPVGS